jgi:hypothetical protein
MVLSLCLFPWHACNSVINILSLLSPLPLYLAFRGEWLDLAYEISGVWPWVQNSGFNLIMFQRIYNHFAYFIIFIKCSRPFNSWFLFSIPALSFILKSKTFPLRLSLDRCAQVQTTKPLDHILLASMYMGATPNSVSTNPNAFWVIRNWQTKGFCWTEKILLSIEVNTNISWKFLF